MSNEYEATADAVDEYTLEQKDLDSYMYDADIFGTRSDLRIGLDVAPFVPTPHRAVSIAMKLAGVREGDVVFDLGAGDARFSIAAAQVHPTVRCVAIENDAARVILAKDQVAKAGLSDQVEVRFGDLLSVDFSEASVLFFFLLPMPLTSLRSSFFACLSAWRTYRIHGI